MPWHSRLVSPNLLKRLRIPSATALDPVDILQRASDTAPLQPVQVVPRLKEGGAYVKIAGLAGSSADQIEERLRAFLRSKPITPWWNPFVRMRARLVRGQPFIEDLQHVPTSRLRVEFVPASAANGTGATDPGVELSVERLYSLLRPYGRLKVISPMPADSKVLPRYALVDFAAQRPAIMAKNCVHGYTVPPAEGGGKDGIVLRLSYSERAKAKWFRDRLFSHPRVVIPAVAAIVATITVAIFDP